MITTPSHAIELLGGAKTVCADLKRPLTTVASWVTRERIPVTAWPALVRLAKARRVRGLTYEALVLAHVGDGR